MSHNISNMDDTIDLRDVIARIEELEDNARSFENPQGDLEEHDTHVAESEELAVLLALMEECKGNGGDEKWRGDWYPVTLVRESYFKEYAQELAEDIGAQMVNMHADRPQVYGRIGQSCLEFDMGGPLDAPDYLPAGACDSTTWRTGPWRADGTGYAAARPTFVPREV